MEHKIFAEVKEKIARYVAEHRLRDALWNARSLAESMCDGAMTREIAAVEDSYRLMLDYAARGAEDPGRVEMARSMGAKVLEIVDCLERENLRADTSTYYFSTLRYETLQRNDTINSLIDDYTKANSQVALFNSVVAGTHAESFRDSLKAREELERRVFNRVWVTHPLTAGDVEAIRMALLSGELPEYFREFLTSAITLGGLAYFDERRIDLLLDAYNGTEGRVEMSAFIGLMLLLYYGRERGFSEKLKSKIGLAMDKPQWSGDLRSTYMAFTKTIDTERITRKICDEVVPEMMKLRPTFDQKLSTKIENLDPAEMEENPEWYEMLEKSGLADKLKEMNEIQAEGGDVMLGTFVHLKSFPFFNEPANWFLPFHTDYSAFSGSDSAVMQPVAELMASAPFLCDSDKFSFMLSLSHVPASQRDMMLSQFKMQESQLAEMQAASLTTAATSREQVLTRQVQNLYRFYHLFRRKGEFRDAFGEPVNLVAVEPLRESVMQLQILPVVAEFYFSHGYYIEAMEIFWIMAETSSPNVQLYQKMGYAQQQFGDLEGAVVDYKRAEMLDSKSDWTLRRLARCLMTLRRPDEALERLRVLESRHPDHVATTLNIGRCLVELGRYDEAIAAYYKAEYLDEKSGKALRPLAWCLLLTGDLERSRKYYEKIITTTDPTAADYLNMGHLALAEHRFDEALNFYSLNIAARSGEVGSEASDGRLGTVATEISRRQSAIDAFIADMKADAPYLRMAGIDETLVPLLVDSLLYRL